MRADVEHTERVSPIKTKKGGKSYIEFIERLASENNYEFLLRDEVLRFKAGAYGDSAITLGWGRDVIRFEPRLNTTAAVTEVIVRAWDAAHKKQIEGRASVGEEDRQEDEKTTASEVARSVFGDVVKVITDRPVRSVGEARRIAQSELNKASNNLVEATVDTVGLPEIVPGACVQINGFGPLFSGKYYVVKTTHTLDRDGYKTSSGLRRNAI
jgi:phage protein D